MPCPPIAIASQIGTLIEGVSGAGAVHLRPQYIRTKSEFLDAYKGTFDGQAQIRAWDVMPFGTLAESEIRTLGPSVEVKHAFTFAVRGLQSMTDDLDADHNYATFADTAWAVKRALDAYQSWDPGDGPTYAVYPTMSVWHSYELRKFGDVACWVAEIRRSVVLIEDGFTLE